MGQEVSQFAQKYNPPAMLGARESPSKQAYMALAQSAIHNVEGFNRMVADGNQEDAILRNRNERADVGLAAYPSDQLLPGVPATNAA